MALKQASTYLTSYDALPDMSQSEKFNELQLPVI
jgi:hypothetical protein